MWWVCYIWGVTNAQAQRNLHSTCKWKGKKKHFKKLHPNFLYIFFSTICPSAVHLHGNVCSNNCDFINQRCYWENINICCQQITHLNTYRMWCAASALSCSRWWRTTTRDLWHIIKYHTLKAQIRQNCSNVWYHPILVGQNEKIRVWQVKPDDSFID